MDKEGLDSRSFSVMYEHAWRYFAFHANQRMVLFRFYIVFFSAFATAACFLLIRFPYERVIHEFSAIFIGVIFIALTIIFHLLDLRNAQLIEYAKDGLRALEVAFSEELKIVTKEMHDVKNKKSTVRHHECLKAIFITGYVAGVLYILAAIISMLYYTGLPGIVDLVHVMCFFGVIILVCILGSVLVIL